MKKILIYLFLVSGFTVGAQEVVPVTPVADAVRELPLTAGEQDREVVPGSRWTFRPLLELGINYDSNVYLARSGAPEDDDYFGDMVVGALLTRNVEQTAITAHGWMRWRRYDNLDDMDSDDVGEKITLRLGEPTKWHLNVEQHYASLADYEYVSEVFAVDPVETTLFDNVRHHTERTQRELLGINGQVRGDVGKKTGVSLQYGYIKIDYEEGYEDSFAGLDNDVRAALANINYYDSESYVAHGDLFFKLTDKTAVVLAADYTTYDGQGLTEGTQNAAARIGLRTDVTAKSAAGIQVGYQWYGLRDDAVDGDDYALENTDAFNFMFYGDWLLTNKTRLRVSGWNMIDPTPDQLNNARVDYVGTVNLAYSMTRRLHWDAAAIYRFEDYLEDAAGVNPGETDNREIEQLSGRIRLSYSPSSQWFRIYGEVSFEDTRDTSYGDYDQLRWTIAGNLRY